MRVPRIVWIVALLVLLYAGKDLFLGLPKTGLSVLPPIHEKDIKFNLVSAEWVEGRVIATIRNLGEPFSPTELSFYTEKGACILEEYPSTECNTFNVALRCPEGSTLLTVKGGSVVISRRIT